MVADKMIQKQRTAKMRFCTFAANNFVYSILRLYQQYSPHLGNTKIISTSNVNLRVKLKFFVQNNFVN